jgi:hypothetical protein
MTYLGHLALGPELNLGLDWLDHIALNHCSLVPVFYVEWSKINAIGGVRE